MTTLAIEPSPVPPTRGPDLTLTGPAGYRYTVRQDATKTAFATVYLDSTGKATFAAPRKAAGAHYVTARDDAGVETRADYTVAAAPPPPPPPPPPPNVTDLQVAINATPAGGTLDVTGQTFKGSYTVPRAMTIVGASVDALGTGRAFTVNADDVTFLGGEWWNGKGATFGNGGLINAYGKSRLTLQEVKLHDSVGSIGWIELGSGHRFIDLDVSKCGPTGIHLHSVSDSLVLRGKYHATGPYDGADGEGAGIKVVKSPRTTFDHVEAFASDGVGLWTDWACDGSKFLDCRVHDNRLQGIFVECSPNVEVARNVVYGNGFGWADWIWGGGILAACSSGAYIHDNTSYDNADLVSVISQNRSPYQSVTGVRVEGNTMIAGRAGTSFGLAQDFAGTLYNGSNGGKANRYDSAAIGKRMLNGCPDLTPYTMTAAETAAALAAVGLP